MSVFLIILIAIASLMYLEGLLCASVVSIAAKQPKWLLPFFIILWPITLPLLGIKMYRKFSPLILEIRNNPLLKTMMQAQLGPPEAEAFNPFAMNFKPTEIVESADGSTTDPEEEKKS